jgi:RNA polymerase sigma-70 factor (ECF subfamily)
MNSTTQTDSATRKSSGETAGFGAFVEEHFDTLYRFAFCMSLAHDRAAELTESVFGEVRELRADGAADKRWMLTSLHRKWSNGEAAESDLSPFATSSVAHTRLISADNLGAVDQSAVLKIVHGMPAELRLVISLFYFENLGPAEIAAILGVPSGTVVARLAEAKTRLRCSLEDQRVDHQSREGPILPAKGGAK